LAGRARGAKTSLVPSFAGKGLKEKQETDHHFLESEVAGLKEATYTAG